MADDAFSLQRAVKDVAFRDSEMAQKIDGEPVKRDSNVRQSAPSPQPRGVNASQAMRTETTGAEGERAFGTPTQSAPKPAEKSEADIRAAIRARVQELKSRQSTDEQN